MFSFIMALFGYLTARLVWDAIRKLAAKQNEMPIVWAFKTFSLLAALAAIVGAFGLAILFVISRSH